MVLEYLLIFLVFQELQLKLLQLVLLGQPELDEKLSRPNIRQLLQRITFSEFLGPMTAQHVPADLAHRLATAALSEAADTQVFGPEAAQALARLSGGVPRLVNVLAHKCLMLAYGENQHRVSVTHVQLAAADTPGVARAGAVPWWLRWRGAVWVKKFWNDRSGGSL